MFKLSSKFKPTGDQPQAIEKLTKGLKAGKKHQVLLGVTGSGKSVVGNTQVLIKYPNNTTKFVEIGALIDEIFKKFPKKIQLIKNSEIINTKRLPKNYHLQTYSFNPKSKITSWGKIKQFTRHHSPRSIYKIKTSCGREIDVTGDHNFWILRNGKLDLFRTKELSRLDYIPLPLEIADNNSNLNNIETINILEGEKLFVDAKPFILRMLRDKSPREIIKIMANFFAFPWQKFYQIKSGRYTGMPLEAVYTIADNLGAKLQSNEINKLVIGSQIHNYHLPANIKLNKEWLELMGYYLAEGSSERESRYFSVAVTEKYLINQIKKILKKLNLSHRKGKNSLIISSKIHTILLSKLLGSRARLKKLPYFWPNLSKRQLGILLKAYFTGDGGCFVKQGNNWHQTCYMHFLV